MTIIFDQLPEALPFESFTYQSSFGRRKLTSCCGFMCFIISTASSGKNNFFRLCLAHKNMNSAPLFFLFHFLQLLASFRFVLSTLFFLCPFYNATFLQYENNSVSKMITITHIDRGVFCGRDCVNPMASFASRRVLQNPCHRTPLSMCVTLRGILGCDKIVVTADP